MPHSLSFDIPVQNLGTPLHCACTNRQNGVQIAELLLEKGAHIDAKKGVRDIF